MVLFGCWQAAVLQWHLHSVRRLGKELRLYFKPDLTGSCWHPPDWRQHRWEEDLTLGLIKSLHISEWFFSCNSSWQSTGATSERTESIRSHLAPHSCCSWGSKMTARRRKGKNEWRPMCCKSTRAQDEGWGKQFSASKHYPEKTSRSHKAVQPRLSAHIWGRWFKWLRWVAQYSPHYMRTANAVKLAYLRHHQCCHPTDKRSQPAERSSHSGCPPCSSWRMSSVVKRVSLTEHGSCGGKPQRTAAFFNKLSISWVCVLWGRFNAWMQILCITFQEFIFKNLTVISLYGLPMLHFRCCLHHMAAQEQLLGHVYCWYMTKMVQHSSRPGKLRLWRGKSQAHSHCHWRQPLFAQMPVGRIKYFQASRRNILNKAE